MDIITQKRKSGIYVLKSPSGKYYVGQSLNFDARMNMYKGMYCKSQRAIMNALKHYGFDAFEVIFMSYPPEMLNWAEKWYVRQYKAFTEGYNCTEGGEGFKVSDETKKKISIANTGRIRTAETKKKMKDAHVILTGEKSRSWKGGANRLCPCCKINKVHISRTGKVKPYCKEWLRIRAKKVYRLKKEKLGLA